MEHQSARPQWMTDEHELYADTCRQLFEAELVPHIDSWRKAGMVDRSFWKKAGDAGLLGATLPEAYGGGGAPMVPTARTAFGLPMASCNLAIGRDMARGDRQKRLPDLDLERRPDQVQRRGRIRVLTEGRSHPGLQRGGVVHIGGLGPAALQIAHRPRPRWFPTRSRLRRSPAPCP